MRTIKFRVWDKKTKKMINLREMESTISIGEHLCFGCEEWGHSYESRCIDENFEIMQFIGLKDKNAKEIYEGDIVKIDNEKHPVITECKYELGFFTLQDNAGGHWARQLFHQSERLEIIGSIYENIKLIKQTK